MKKKAKKSRFDVAADWPLDRISLDSRKEAIQELVANHTLIVGQSRSGKTMAARRLVEEIIAWTDTRVVILDPNGDFTLLNKLSEDPDLAASVKEFRNPWRKVAKEIVVATPGKNFGIYWGALELADMSAFLRLTPETTFAEYRHLDRHRKFEEQTKGAIGSLRDFLNSKYFGIAVGEDLERYRLRIEHLLELGVWAEDGTKDLASLFTTRPKAVVIDLSTDDEQKRMITAGRTLESLWREGDALRKEFLKKRDLHWPGTLVVIDEGHVFAPPPNRRSPKAVGIRTNSALGRFRKEAKSLFTGHYSAARKATRECIVRV